MIYKEKIGKNLNLENPQTLNEKIQWLKLNYKNNIYTTMVDKYKVKEYVANIIGSEYIIPTLGVYDNFDEINFDELPNQFVIKCNHDSDSIVICKDKSNLDKNVARKKINKCLKTDFYRNVREWAYKNVDRKIIIEKYIEEKETSELRDYKFFCFSGKVKYLYVSSGSHTINQKLAFFDKKYNYVNIKRTDYSDYEILPKKPKNFEKMIRLAEKLAENTPLLRVDFYEVNNKVYFGELTVYPGAGLMPFKSEEWDYKLGDLLDLSKIDRSK